MFYFDTNDFWSTVFVSIRLVALSIAWKNSYNYTHFDSGLLGVRFSFVPKVLSDSLGWNAIHSILLLDRLTVCDTISSRRNHSAIQLHLKIN